MTTNAVRGRTRYPGTIDGRLRGTFIPTHLTDLSRWYRADSLALNDSDAVSQWLDESGNEVNMEQGTGASQPLYKTNILNGKPVLRFDGSDDFLWASYTKPARLTLMAVLSPRNATARMLLSGGVDSNEDIPWVTMGINNATTFRYYISTGWRFIGTAHATNEYKLHTLTFDTTTWRRYLNGGTADTLTANQNGDSGNLFLGRGYGGAAACDIAEVIAYSRVVTDTERALLLSYLNGKYALW